ncbi:MAG: YihY family inner membrane protein [Halieaceae bacterium]|jgi:membrane protein|nr:YihY family inner membrane protein [Halieaceae bacterium]
MDILTSPPVESLRHRLVYLIRRYGDDNCRDTAAALTYISLFALVPLLTVLFTIASAVPAFEGVEGSIQDLLFEHLVPETSAGLQEYLEDFSRQARNLTGFGIAVLLVTAILMLRSIEQAFNRIWRTRNNRGAVSSFLLYWAVLSLAPITIGLGLGASTYLAAFAGRLEQWGIIGIGSLMLFLAPYLLQITGFTLVYAAIPNCRVPLRHAAAGGVIAGITFNVARALFTKLVAGSSITFIYGAFAAVPLFLLWIYISWNIVLVCAIITHSLSAYRSDARSRRPLILKGLELLESLWRSQAVGEGLREVDLLARGRPAIDSESWQLLRDRFFAVHLIARDEDGRYRLARDLHDVPLWQLQEWLLGDGELAMGDRDGLPAWEQRAVSELMQQRRDKRAQLTVSLAELFKSQATADATPSTRNGGDDVYPARIMQG